jgi:hypothetical protein
MTNTGKNKSMFLLHFSIKALKAAVNPMVFFPKHHSTGSFKSYQVFIFLS